MPAPATTSRVWKPLISPSVKLLWLAAAGMLILGVVYYIWQNFQVNLGQPQPQPAIQAFPQGKIIVGTDATFPPMEFTDDQGNLLGYDVDLANRLAEELNLGLELRSIPWDQLFISLENHQIDMIISSVTITDERRQKYLFSNPYLNVGQVIITRADDTSITGTAHLQGKKIAVQAATTNEQQAYNFTAPEMVLKYDDFISATQALLAGEVQAIFSDLTGAKGIVDEHPQLKIASDPFTDEFYGAVFSLGDSLKLKAINQALDHLRQRGVLVFLQQKWL